MYLRIFLLSLLYFGLMADMHFAPGGWKQDFEWRNIFSIVLSYLFLVSVFFAVDAFFKRKKARWINSFLAFFYGLLASYHTNTGANFDMSLVFNNGSVITTFDGLRQTIHLIHDTFVAANAFWSLLAAGLIYGSYSWDPSQITAPKAQRVLKYSPAVLFLSIYLLFSYSHDQFSLLTRSFLRWYFPFTGILAEQSQKSRLLPRVKVQSRFPSKEKPHVFLVLVESFNGAFLHGKNEKGQEYMPFTNSLAKKALYIRNYFSPSVQTAKGHFAILCGQVPSLKNIEFRENEDFTGQCLPQVLKDQGYQTHFAQAYNNLNFDNSRTFLLSHGFENMPQIAKDCGQETEPCYGWGIRDDVFYRRSFQYLKENADPTKAQFITMATIVSHQPFNALPSDLREFYKNPNNRRESYINYLKIIDDGLKIFFAEFEKSPYAKNSIVIVTGDHGFPLGEHGNSHNENYAYNENFQVPFLLLDTRQDLKTKEVWVEGPFSHLNVPATILDLASISRETDFVAESLFIKKFRTQGDRVYLVQPYSGSFVAIIQWPYKYIFELQREREEVFNLSQDPIESVNILRTDLDEATLSGLRAVAGQVLRQQEVLTVSKKSVEALER